MNVIDQTNDPGYSTLRVLAGRFPKIQELVKTANLGPEEWSGLPDSAFAWPEKRQFPIHNREHAALSYGYRKMASMVPAGVDVILEKAADAYSIDKTVFESPVVFEKVANETWLLPEKGRFRVTSAEDVKLAESLFLEKFSQFEAEDRAEAFINLGKAAEQYGVKLSPSTQKIAGFTITSTRILKDWINARKEASFGKAASLAFDKLASEYKNAPEYIMDQYHQVKLAEIIHKLDKDAGLTEFYGKKLPDPIQTVFNTEKKASGMVHVGSMPVDKAALAALPLEFWQDVLGPEVAKEIAPSGQVDPELLAQVLPTLPADIMALVQKQLSGM